MDITKCNGEGCVLKDKCKRFTAPSGEFMQVYISAPYTYINGRFECELFWGDESDLLLEQLKSIMNGTENKKA